MLLHFNPINLMLKYTIIKFESFTSIIIHTKSKIFDMTHERYSFKSDIVLTHLSNNTNEDNVRRYKEFEAKLLADGLDGLDEYMELNMNLDEPTHRALGGTLVINNSTYESIYSDEVEDETY